MDQWRPERANECIHAFGDLTPVQQRILTDLLDRRFPPSVYDDQCRRLDRAQAAARALREMLARATVEYPRTVDAGSVDAPAGSLHGCAVVFTAGGEGERMRLSLLEKGSSPDQMRDFTKATHPVPGLPNQCGALQANLLVVRHLAQSAGVDIPVIVTVGPAGSSTARVIPSILARNEYFGLPRVRIIEQDERLHLTVDRKIAYRLEEGAPVPVTNPDETGGPLVKLRSIDPSTGRSILDWVEELGCRKAIVLQATAVYDPSLIVAMAGAARSHDGLGVGIPRRQFPASDPYGTFAAIRDGASTRLMIVESSWRSEAMRELRDPTGVWRLPYNTGFYVFDTRVLRDQSLPDYCTPPKEVLPGLPRAPKTGYSATDILPLASRPAVLTVAPESFAVLKNVDDLSVVAAVAKRFGIDKICREAV